MEHPTHLLQAFYVHDSTRFIFSLNYTQFYINKMLSLANFKFFLSTLVHNFIIQFFQQIVFFLACHIFLHMNNSFSSMNFVHCNQNFSLPSRRNIPICSLNSRPFHAPNQVGSTCRSRKHVAITTLNKIRLYNMHSQNVDVCAHYTCRCVQVCCLSNVENVGECSVSFNFKFDKFVEFNIMSQTRPC